MGRVICAGLGPGDPDLMSVRAARAIASAAHVAYFRKAGRPGQARAIVEGMLAPAVTEYPMEYPVTTELPVSSADYNDALARFYDDWAARLAAIAAETDVVVLCEGDPFFYGSFMHLHSRLQGRAEVEVIPGITGMTGCWTATGQPITWGDDVLTVLMGTLPEEDLVRHMAAADALVVMKTGRNLPKVRRALDRAGRLDAAWLVERGTMPKERVARLAEVDAADCPYFAIVLVHGQGRRPELPGPDLSRMSGWLAIAGLGPGAGALVTPEVTAALAGASDVLGYVPYVARVAPRPGLVLHPSDNREELDRARAALRLAGEGRRVVVVSSGDPGVFAMAAAVFEALEDMPAHRDLDIRVLPGITAMLAAAARIGAPLGHDFCCINLSDNLKPWALIERRLRLAAEADLAMAFYNPRSVSRPEGFARALEVLREACEPARLISFARAVSTPDEAISTVTLAEARPEMADMRTLVILGNAATRRVGRWVYAPRRAG